MDRRVQGAQTALTAAAVALVAAGCHVSRAAELAENQAIVRELPVYPAARLVETTDAGEYTQEGVWSHATGYDTNLWYRLARPERGAAIAGFYARALDGEWRRAPSDVGPDVVCWTRGDDHVALMPDARSLTAPTRSYQLLVGRGSSVGLC